MLETFLLVSSELFEIPVNLFQALFHTTDLMADGVKESFCHKLRPYHGVKEVIAVYRYGQKDRGILGQKSTWLVRDYYDFAPASFAIFAVSLSIEEYLGKLKMIRQSSLEMLQI